MFVIGPFCTPHSIRLTISFWQGSFVFIYHEIFCMNLPIERTWSIIKEGIVNLNGEELDENKIKLLNLDPKFIPTENGKRLYMDII